MKLFTKRQLEQLKKNSERVAEGEVSSLDLKPVVKLFNPVGAATWLLTEMDDEGYAFGLCDLGLGFPELGEVYIPELEAVKGPFGLGIERDQYITLDKTLRDYDNAARKASRITV